MDRTTGYGHVSQTIESKDGVKFVQCTSGMYTSFLVREDGLVWYTKGWGKFNTMTAQEDVPGKTIKA